MPLRWPGPPGPRRGRRSKRAPWPSTAVQPSRCGTGRRCVGCRRPHAPPRAACAACEAPACSETSEWYWLCPRSLPPRDRTQMGALGKGLVGPCSPADSTTRPLCVPPHGGSASLSWLFSLPRSCVWYFVGYTITLCNPASSLSARSAPNLDKGNATIRDDHPKSARNAASEALNCPSRRSQEPSDPS